MKFIVFFLVSFFISTAFARDDAASLSLDNYLLQVKNQNLTYLSSSQNAEAYELLRQKAKLVTAVTFFAKTETGFIEQNQALQIFRYSKVYSQNTQIGFSQVSDLGVNTKIYYSLNHSTYKNLNTANSTNPKLAQSNYQGTPKLEVSLPLWQNRFGAATKSIRDSVYYNNESQKLLARSVSLEELVASQKAYWRLAAVKQMTEIQRVALKNAKLILDYVSKRERMNLGDKSDVMQAKALFESKKLSLQQTENDLRIAARNFNKHRYIDSDEVVEKLDNIDFKQIKEVAVPKNRVDDRLDIKANEADMKAAIAQARVEEEANKPSLNLYGSYATNQVEAYNTAAINNIGDQKGRAAMVGINFSTPVNFGMSSDIRKGARQGALAAKTSYRQKVFQQENDWQNLVQNLESYKESLVLSETIETAQKLKLENERMRLKQGRTNTYQVLLFEQEYSNSQIVKIQNANKILDLIADEKLYEGSIR
jgi:outer membrane protein TolC